MGLSSSTQTPTFAPNVLFVLSFLQYFTRFIINVCLSMSQSTLDKGESERRSGHVAITWNNMMLIWGGYFTVQIEIYVTRCVLSP